ncbi:MAG: alpha/beta fold hydrolase [Bacteroidota bacterium]|nr:alpha/beta fold hydrolase [Bacteroidota bacterium]
MEKNLDFRNKQIHYSQSGNGPCLVLLHGFLESLQIWDSFRQPLENDFTVICIDLPGFGKSDVFSENHNMDFMAEVVYAVLQENKIDQCVMAGHSMGGYVSLAFARNYPAMLKGLCLYHSHAAADNEEAKENRNRTLEIVDKGKKNFINNFIPTLFAKGNVAAFDEQIEQLKAWARETSAEGIKAALQGMRDRQSQLNLLTETDIPIQFIIGKQDKKIPFNKILAQVSLCRHSEIIFLREAGHMGFVEAPKICLQAMTSFAKNAHTN